MEYTFLQEYWWLIISILASALVFLLFIQGGQSQIYTVAKTDEERKLLVNCLGRKWEFTFTTLVTFGASFFASFPLFYSTSFGGAVYVWVLILLTFVILPAAYEFRTKDGNLLGTKTYNTLLVINGVLSPLLIGTAVGTFFTGANFTVDLSNLANPDITQSAISRWTNGWHGLEAVLDYRNVSLGLAVLFLARCLSLQYFINNIDDSIIEQRSRKQLRFDCAAFLIFFLTFLISILFATGWAVDAGGAVSMEKYKFFNNLIQNPVTLAFLLLGVVLVLFGLYKSLLTKSRKGIWFTGFGTVFAVLALFFMVGYNGTPYYPSLANMQDSLTIYNSSSSELTLKVMAIVSLAIPIVVCYIWYSWREMDKKKITREELKGDGKFY